jgi:hypothetical protein
MSRRAYWNYTRHQPPVHPTMLSPELLAQNPKCTFSMTCFRPWCVYVCCARVSLFLGAMTPSIRLLRSWRRRTRDSGSCHSHITHHAERPFRKSAC